jgi:DNA-binding NarL/FixJ family response regulator
LRLDVLRAVEACYAPTPDDAAWLGGVLEALSPLDAGQGALAEVHRGDGAAALEVECSAQRGGRAPRLAAGLRELYRALSADDLRRLLSPERPVRSAGQRADRAGAAVAQRVRALLRPLGAEDSLWITAAGPGGRTALVAVLVAAGRSRLGPRTAHRLALFAAHLASALRLRCALRARSERESLAAAARRLGGAGLPARRCEPDDALRLWGELVAGTWSLVDGCDSDGRRHVLARRNAPGVQDPKAMTSRERAVVAFAAMGHQNKSIAHELGLSTSAVARIVDSACRKLALGSRAELVRNYAALVAPASDPR